MRNYTIITIALICITPLNCAFSQSNTVSPVCKSIYEDFSFIGRDVKEKMSEVEAMDVRLKAVVNNGNPKYDRASVLIFEKFISSLTQAISLNNKGVSTLRRWAAANCPTRAGSSTTEMIANLQWGIGEIVKRRDGVRQAMNVYNDILLMQETTKQITD